jgi:hypothetical protein
MEGWSLHSKAVRGRKSTHVHASRQLSIRPLYLFTYTLADVSCFFLFSGSGEDEECLLLCTSFTSGLLSVLADGEIDL